MRSATAYRLRTPPGTPTPLSDFAASALYVADSAILRNRVGQAHYSFLHNKKSDYVALLVEATLALYWQVRNSTNTGSLVAAFTSFYHAVSGCSCTGSALRFIGALVGELKDELPWFQSGTDWIDVLDGLYTNTKKVVKSALGDKVARVFNHVVALALYKKADIELDPILFGDLEKKKIRPTIWDVASFADAVTGLIVFLCKAGRQAILTGNIDCLFIDEGVLSDWIDRASRLKKESEFTGNPSAIGMELPIYIEDVKDCVAMGNKLMPHFRKGREHTVLLNMVLELETVLKRLQISLNASAFRRAPIGVFLYGTAGVAKSHIALGLLNHYCAVRGIPKESATMWTRTENDPFYSGYKSHFAGVLYDDAAKYRANVVQGVDQSIGDIISAINNIQFVTPQADLPDKGKIPFRAEWVGVTSNIDNLNANLYFNSSAAFLRRLSVRITPTVKEEFRVPGEDKIDVNKIPAGEQYPDLWTFDVHVPKVAGLEGQFVLAHHFDHYADLLLYMTGVYEKHIAHQTALLETVGKIGPEKICACRLPASICRCEPVPSTDPLLFGSFESETQADYKPTSHWFRVSRLMQHKHIVYGMHKDKVVRAFLNDLFDSPEVVKWYDPSFADASFGTDEEIVERIVKYTDECIEEFLAYDARDRINHITDHAFNRVDGHPDMPYLTFTPKYGPRGFYLDGQMKSLRNTVIKFCPTFSAKELAVLDVYLAEEAPRHISNGWSMGDIIRGGLDYVKHYAAAIEDPDRVEAREFMMGTRKSSFVERIGVRIAVAYFERPWVHSTINCLTQFTVCQKLAAWWIVRCSSPDKALLIGATNVDRARGGSNPMFRMIVTAVATMSVFAAAYTLYCMMTKKNEREVGTSDRGSARSCMHSGTGNVEQIPADAAAQMDLNDIGRRPAIREGEKANVWCTKERAITRLDVDPRRPHNDKQAASMLANNVLFARVYGVMPSGPGYANTRVLAVDSETLVVNNHALPRNSRLEIWLGPVTEEGVRPSYVVEINEELVTRYPDRDVAIIKTWANPHRFKDIKHLFAKKTFQSVGPSSYYIRSKDGSVEDVPCVGVCLSGLRGLAGAGDVVCEAWSSRPQRPTVSGDCGSPLVVHSTLGSVVVGFHAGYNALTNTAWAVRLFREDFDDERHPEIGYIKPAYPIAQVGQFLNLGPRDKLYTDYHESGHIMTHGQIKCFVARPKFTGHKTPHANFLFSVGHEFEPPIVDNMAAPRNAGWKQPQMVLANYLKPTHSMNELIVRACVQAFCDRIRDGLTEEDLADIHPVPIDVAVNGMPGVPNVDAQKHSTSAGHGKRGPKLQYLSEPAEHDVWDAYREFDAETLREIDEMREAAYAGVRPHAIYDSCWKNEMLSLAKVMADRARSIYMCPVAFLVNMRMSTLGLCRVMIKRRHLFCLAVGLNTHSEEWDDTHKEAQRILGDLWIAGDFKAFESVLGLLLSNAVSKIFVFIATLCGNFNADELMALRVWLADISNATINFFGELITLLGGEASGQQLTTFFNCLANVLLHMYAYVVVNKKADNYEEYYRIAVEFFVKVFCNTLGDDVYLKVDESRKAYNHTTIQGAFRDIGITYTMADKDAESRPFIGLDEVTFLKRSFVDHESFPGMKVAALDRRSVYKMLCYTVPSHSASAEQQQAAAISSAFSEAFFHGSDFFKQIADVVSRMPKSQELEHRMMEFPPPSWNDMVMRFVKASPKLRARMLVPDDVKTTETKRSYCHASELELQMEWRVDAWGSTVMGRSPAYRVYGSAWLCTKSPPTGVMLEIADDPDNIDFSKNINKVNNTAPTPLERDLAPKVVAKAINKVRTQKRRKMKRENWDAVAQADIVYDTLSVPNTTTGATDVVQEHIVFKNEPQGPVVPVGNFTDDMVTNMELSQSLAKYLSRPRLIFSYAWIENTANGVKTDFNPWQLFFADFSMASKLEGYGLMRSKLCLKFLINGSPFYYGSLMAAYTPLSGWRPDTASSGAVQTSLIPYSQKPHVWLENQNCSTAHMELPFLYPYPYLDVMTSQRLADMGKITLVQYAALLSANGTSSTPIDIQVYAWAEDVVLTGPTNLPVVQSEFHHDGQISSTASAVASAAGALSNVPILGPYAKATSMAASGVGKVASLFGFTNVPNVSDVQPVKQMPFSLASTEISEPVAKLSLQAKAETALGAEQHGGPACDELAFNSFLTRSSFLVGSSWTTSGVVGETIFTTAVAPQMFDRTSTQIAHTPLSYAANFFQYWRGSIKYTFKVVRSPYHRGRIQISWDAKANNLNQGPLLGNPNTISTIMDLDEESECSFVVPYMQPELFTKTYAIDNTGTVLWSTASAPAASWLRANGMLSVRVLNRLTAPEPSSGVTVLVFVQACDDFEFAAPRDFDVYNGNNILSLSPLTVGVAQSDIHYDDAAESHDIAPTGKASNLYHNVFGERVSSFREYMHRSSLSFVYNPVNTSATAGVGVVRVPVKRIPPPPGVYNNGWWLGTTSSGAGQTVFYTKMHPIVGLGACFMGYKGSVNLTINVDQPVTNCDVDTLCVYRVANGDALSAAARTPQAFSLFTTTGSAAVNTRDGLLATDAGRAGMALTNTKTNTGLSVQLPFYSSAAFSLFNPFNEYNNQDTLCDTNNDWWNIEWRYNKAATATTATGSLTSVYYATGPDFDFVYFINVPVLNLVSVTPV